MDRIVKVKVNMKGKTAKKYMKALTVYLHEQWAVTHSSHVEKNRPKHLKKDL